MTSDGDVPIHVPDDPLGRYLAVHAAVVRRKHWTDGYLWLRYAALGLVLAPGDPEHVATQFHELARDLREQAGWFGTLRSPLRFCVAASLLRRGERPAPFVDAVERTRALFREHKLPRGGTYEVLVVLVLHELGEGRIAADSVARLAEVYREMKEHHPFFTGGEDLVACALLAHEDERPAAMHARIERLYDGLRDLRFARSNQLQTASHILYFSPAADDVALARFRDLYAAFGADGLRMERGDYDEVAILAFLDHGLEEIVRRVAAHRARLHEQRPRPSKSESFTLACNTVFLELAGRDAGLRPLTGVDHLLHVVALVQAQQAAMMAAAAAATSAAAAS